MKRTSLNASLLIVIMLSILAISYSQETADVLLGAGATFPAPLYGKWFRIYHEQTSQRVDYQAVGSGGGIDSFLDRKVDFGATDAYLSDSILSRNEDVLHIPTCIGAVVVTYNLPNNPVIRLSSELIAKIFLGEIDNWNDSKIARLNNGVKFPDAKIVIVHRSDPSGTTFIFTDYLSKNNPEWSNLLGSGKTVRWTSGLGVEGNSQVVATIKKISGSIGYTELNYVQSNKLATALIKNRAGNFAKPTTGNVRLNIMTNIPADLRMTISDSGDPNDYPIGSYSWIIVYKEQAYNSRSFTHAQALQDMLYWIVKDGQDFNDSLGYSPIPVVVSTQAQKLIHSMTYHKALINE